MSTLAQTIITHPWTACASMPCSRMVDIFIGANNDLHSLTSRDYVCMSAPVHAS